MSRAPTQERVTSRGVFLPIEHVEHITIGELGDRAEQVNPLLIGVRQDENRHQRQSVLELRHFLQRLLECGEPIKRRGHLRLIVDLGASRRLQPGVDDDEVWPEALSAEIG